MMRISAIAAVAAVLGSLGCAAPRGAPFDAVGRRFLHRVAFDLGKSEVIGDDRIVVDEVSGTRPNFEVGGDTRTGADPGIGAPQVPQRSWKQNHCSGPCRIAHSSSAATFCIASLTSRSRSRVRGT